MHKLEHEMKRRRGVSISKEGIKFCHLATLMITHLCRTSEGDGGGATVAPEMTKKFFESILRNDT